MDKEVINKIILEKDLKLEEIVYKLEKIQKQNIFDELFHQYVPQQLSSEEINNVLEDCKWDKDEAIKLIRIKIKQREEEKKQKELEMIKQIERQNEIESQLQEEINLQREKQKQIQMQLLEKEKEIQFHLQKELEMQKEKEKEKDQKIEIEQEKKLVEKQLQEQINLLKQKELEQQEQQRQRQLEFEKILEEHKRQLEIQRIELENEKQRILEQKSNPTQPPQLVLDEKEIKELGDTYIESIKKNLLSEEQKNEEEQKNTIQQIVFEHSLPPEENEKSGQQAGNKCVITFTEKDNKLVAKIDFKNQTTYPWIGFYKKDDPDSQYIAYNYLSSLKDSTFEVERPSLNGSYHFRCFSSRYAVVATSDDVVLNKEDKLTMETDENNDKITNVSWDIGSFDPYAMSAYVTIHIQSEQRPNYYRRWNWIKTNSGTHTFKTPIHNETYEARLYHSGKLQLVSKVIVIDDGIPNQK